MRFYKMNTENEKLFDSFSENQILDFLKEGLRNGINIDLDKSYDVTDITIKNYSILVTYIPEINNKLVIYTDFAQIIGCVHGFLSNDFESQNIRNIGVQARLNGENLIYILSPIDSAKAISTGNTIYWLKNSFVDEPLTAPKETYFLVEGESELVAFPILFNAMNADMEIQKIQLYPYSKKNLKTLLSILNHKQDKYFLVSDNDKKKEINDLVREGLLARNFHILEHGEFEDYIEPEVLVGILESLSPSIGITASDIDEGRNRNKSTSNIISKYYSDNAITFQRPSKPEIAEKAANQWSKIGLPEEIKEIIKKVLSMNNEL